MLYMHMQDLTEAQNVLEGLSVALQHPAVAADQRNISTLLQVCKGWRSIVQQSTASMTDIRLWKRLRSASSLSIVTNFAGWIVKYPGLIDEMDVQLSCETDINSEDATALVEAANKLVDFSLEVAGASAPSVSGAPLLLKSYASSAPLTGGLLAALPAATLTQLRLRKLANSRWSLSLQRLSNYKELHVDMREAGTNAANSFLQDVGRLQQLTQLSIDDPPLGSDMRLLPTSLQKLETRNSGVDANTGAAFHPILVDLQHLTSLDRLRLSSWMRELGPGTTFAEGSSVPTSLLSLYTSGRWPEQGLVGLTSLSQVTSLQLWEVRDSCRVQHLTSMQRLTQLKQLLLYLSYDEIDEGPPHNGILKVAAVWGKLPLSCLRIKGSLITPAALQQLMQHVAAASQLNDLMIAIKTIQLDAVVGDAPPLAMCEHLTGLQKLDSLDLCIGQPKVLTDQDAQHLSALVALTRLHVEHADAGPPVDATTIGLLGLSLTQLKVLALKWLENGEAPHRLEPGGLNSYAIPAIAQLTNLEDLRLGTFTAEDAERGLQLLTGLSKLAVLLGFSNARQEAQEAFWAVVPG